MSERLESRRFPYLRLAVEIRGRSLEVEALIDTGFDGDVALPASALRGMGAADLEARAWLAGGSPVSLPAYEADVRVGSWGPFLGYAVALGDEPTVGRGITDRFRVILDHGREVIVES